MDNNMLHVTSEPLEDGWSKQESVWSYKALRTPKLLEAPRCYVSLECKNVFGIVARKP